MYLLKRSRFRVLPKLEMSDIGVIDHASGTFVLTSSHLLTTKRRQSDMWPASLVLSPSREPCVSSSDLQAWIRKHQPALCDFRHQPRNVDPKTNETHFQSLIHLLTAKKLVCFVICSGRDNSSNINSYSTPSPPGHFPTPSVDHHQHAPHSNKSWTHRCCLSAHRNPRFPQAQPLNKP